MLQQVSGRNTTFRVKSFVEWTGKFSNEIAYTFTISIMDGRKTSVWFILAHCLVISTIINSILYRERKLKQENELLERRED